MMYAVAVVGVVLVAGLTIVAIRVLAALCQILGALAGIVLVCTGIHDGHMKTWQDVGIAIGVVGSGLGLYILLLEILKSAARSHMDSNAVK